MPRLTPDLLCPATTARARDAEAAGARAAPARAGGEEARRGDGAAPQGGGGAPAGRGREEAGRPRAGTGGRELWPKKSGMPKGVSHDFKCRFDWQEYIRRQLEEEQRHLEILQQQLLHEQAMLLVSPSHC